MTDEPEVPIVLTREQVAKILFGDALTPAEGVKEVDYLVRKRKIGCYKNRREVATFGPHHIKAYLLSIEQPAPVAVRAAPQEPPEPGSAPPPARPRRQPAAAPSPTVRQT